MLTKRIIPCLDIKNGRTVKGVNFERIRDAGDPVELAQRYAAEGADELVFLDISATNEGRKTVVDLVRQIAYHINIPFTIGGGISSVQDAALLLNAGADKVSINSSAVANPMLIDELALHFGSQFVLVAIDTRLDSGQQMTDDKGEMTNKEQEISTGSNSAIIGDSSSIVEKHYVHTHGGKRKTELRTVNWAKEAAARGAGEILLTSMNADGTKAGFDLPITKYLSEQLAIPVIASGGAGTMQHFTEVFQQANADAALAASIFHFGEISVPDLKQYLFGTENINTDMNNLIPIASIIALLIFGYMRNRQADRNDKRRERLEEKQEQLFEMLQSSKKSSTDNSNTDEK